MCILLCSVVVLFCIHSTLRIPFYISGLLSRIVGRCFTAGHALYWIYGDDISSGDIFSKNICISHRFILPTMVCWGLFYAVWFVVAIGARV